jgi:hypothetical protein
LEKAKKEFHKKRKMPPVRRQGNEEGRRFSQANPELLLFGQLRGNACHLVIG